MEVQIGPDDDPTTLDADDLENMADILRAKQMMDMPEKVDLRLVDAVGYVLMPVLDDSGLGYGQQMDVINAVAAEIRKNVVVGAGQEEKVAARLVSLQPGSPQLERLKGVALRAIENINDEFSEDEDDSVSAKSLGIRDAMSGHPERTPDELRDIGYDPTQEIQDAYTDGFEQGIHDKGFYQ